MDIGSADGNAQDDRNDDYGDSNDGDDDYDGSKYRGNGNDERIDGNGDDENRNDGNDDDDDNNDGNAYKLFAALAGVDVVDVDSGAITHAPPMGIARKLHATAASAAPIFVFGGLYLTGMLSSCNSQRLARFLSVYF